MNQPVAAGPHRRGRRWPVLPVSPCSRRPLDTALAVLVAAGVALAGAASPASPAFAAVTAAAMPAAVARASSPPAPPAPPEPADAGRRGVRPSSLYLQAGVAEEAQMLVIGATWDWRWHRDFAIGRLSGYWEASFGRWNSDTGPRSGSAWVTQLGVTPVLRLYPDSWGGDWFVEGGIGVNFLLPIYRSESKRFSTAFNFGDHLAIGRRFGPGGRHDLALRIQHFSNGSIKKPNPGEDFLQIRYSRRF